MELADTLDSKSSERELVRVRVPPPVQVIMINIIDLEATCWDKRPPNGVQSEIIEIGVATIDVRAQKIIAPKERFFVYNPQMRISAFCENLTGIHLGQLRAEGRSLEDTFEVLKNKFAIHKRPWMSWGDYDRKQLTRECTRKGITYPFADSHTNLKLIFSLQAGIFPTQLSVKNALKHLNMKFIGTPHSGADDAYNIARIFLTLFNKENKC